MEEFRVGSLVLGSLVVAWATARGVLGLVFHFMMRQRLVQQVSVATSIGGEHNLNAVSELAESR